MTESLGFSHFLEHMDAAGILVIVLLTAMSVATWFLIIIKSWNAWLSFSSGKAYLRRFRAAGTLASAQHLVAEEYLGDPFARLAAAAWEACRQLRQPQAAALIEAPPGDEYLAAALDHVLATELAHLEESLVVLSSVASTAPFIGLFGTVWGIYHALLAIGASGQASLDQLAGAVGEALIMTGCGLVVAIPAVLGYNALTYWNGKMMGRLQSFAHELTVLLTTGSMATSGTAEPVGVMPQILPAE